MRRRAITGAGAALLTLAACAKMAAPPGGPVDNDPPVLLEEAIRPPRGAVGVRPDSAFVLVFSERTDHRSVMRALSIFPPVDFARVDWQGDTLRLVPEEGWAPERGTLIRIEGSARDRRGNVLGTPFQTTFTTKAVPDSGRITGRAWAGRELDGSRRLLVLAWTPRDLPEPGERWPAAIADATSGKEFRLEGLDTALPWHVAAVIEGEGGLRGTPPGGVELVWPDLILFPDGESEVALGEFLVGTLDTLGTIAGSVKTDSARVAFVVARPAAEVSAMAAAAAEAAAAEPEAQSDAPTADGEMAAAEDDEEIPAEEKPAPPWSDWILDAPLRAGPVGTADFALRAPTDEVYRVGAFVDVDADSVADPDEPRVALERDVSLRYVSKAEGLRFDLRGLAPWPVVADSAAADSAAADSAGADEGRSSGTADPDESPREETGP